VQTLAPRTNGVIQVVLPHPGPRVEPPLRVEVELGPQPGDQQRLKREIEDLIRARLTVRADVTLVPPGTLERTEMKSRLTRIEAKA